MGTSAFLLPGTFPCNVMLAPDPYTGYHSWGDPTRVTVCGVDIDLEARPDTGADDRYVWIYQANFWPTSIPFQYWTSGPTTPTGTFGDTPVILNFLQPVKEVRVVWSCSTVPGNEIVAYDLNGAVLVQRSVAYGPPVEGCASALEVISAPQIRSLKVIPSPPFDFTTNHQFVQFWIVPDSSCPPVGDAVIDSPEVQQGFRDAMEASKPDSLPGTGFRKETGGYVWERPDGTFFTQFLLDPGATECSYTPPQLPPAPEPGAVAHGRFHTHPQLTGESVYECPGASQSPGDNKPVPIARPNDNGGGSAADWLSTRDGYPTYAYTKEGVAYRLDPDTPVSARKSNPHKWNLPRNAGCPAPRP